MTKKDFLIRLENLLQDVPQAEREEALQYYADYIEDAGEENEEDVIASLGTPRQVADNIKEELAGDGLPFADAKKTTKAVTEPFGIRNKNEIVVNDTVVQEETRDVPEYEMNYNGNAGQPGQSGKSGAMITLIVIALVFASPLILSVGGALIGVIAAVFGIWVGCAIALPIIMAVLLFLMVVFLVVGIICFVFSPVAGFAVCGTGLLLGGAGFLLLILTVGFFRVVNPAIGRGIKKLFRRLKGGRRA